MPQSNTTLPPSTHLNIELRQSTPFIQPPSSTTTSLHPPPLNWWKSVTCYQIWPASFNDSNGDGIGDLRGILSKLDHLHDLGITCIWLSPMYASPQKDMGYDISDYEAIHPAYGTMADMDTLIAGCHDRGMKLLLDLVVNHTSDQHRWFQESCTGDGPYRDFYIWKDAKIDEDGNRKEPNNWGSMFGGSAWEWVESRQQYYLHLFAKEQPDLNWEVDEVRQEIRRSAMLFWLDKGIDGFRVDTCNLYSKDQRYLDGVVEERFKPWGSPVEWVLDGPRMHEWWKEIRREVFDHYDDPMVVGELGGASFEQVMRYVGREERELSMVFDFDLAKLGGHGTVPPYEVHGYKLPEAKRAVQKWQDWVMTGEGWATTFKENHDLPRSVNKHGAGEGAWWARSAKVLCMLTTTLSGTLFVYQGEEIGMTNIPLTWGIEDSRDVAAINYYRALEREHPGDKELLERAWRGIRADGRDNARTPVQWSSDEHAGFTTGKPWMRVNDNYRKINVADQMTSGDSVLAFWKSMIILRKKYADVLVHGSYKVHDLENELSYTFEKRGKNGRLGVVVLNFSAHELDLRWPEGSDRGSMELLMSNVAALSDKLQPWEGRLYMQKEA